MSPLADEANRLLFLEQQWHDDPRDFYGLDTGLESLNQATGGLTPGVTVVGAYTSHGKSALTAQIAEYVAMDLFETWSKSGDAEPAGQVMVFNIEMTPTQILSRFATRQSRVPSIAIKRGQASEEQRESWRGWVEAAGALDPVLKVHTGQFTYEDIVDTVDQTAEMGGPPIQLVVIDYIQLVGIEQRMSEYEALKTIVNGLKSLANRYEVPVLVAAQLRRDIEKDNIKAGDERPPELSDLHGGGVLGTAPDQVWLLWNKPAPTRTEGSKPRGAVLFVKKNRDGPVGDCPLVYYPDTVLFADPPHVRVRLDGGL